MNISAFTFQLSFNDKQPSPQTRLPFRRTRWQTSITVEIAKLTIAVSGSAALSVNNSTTSSIKYVASKSKTTRTAALLFASGTASLSGNGGATVYSAHGWQSAE
jgi:hypothetical protein